MQPRHIYAPECSIEKNGHIYMPTSLLAMAAILLDAGLEISILDENIGPHFFDNRILGINLIGAPYIPAAIEYAKNLKLKYNDDCLLILGGQVVSGLPDGQINQLFGSNVINGNNPETIAKNLNVEIDKFKSVEEISLIPAYLKLSDDYMRLYLKNEFGFYLSQGCKYACDFCAASRSVYDETSNLLVKNKETYRDLDVACSDLEYLVATAQRFGLKSLNLYLSNLDLFQSPLTLGRFAEKVTQLKIRNNNFSINLRGLSNVRSFLHAHKTHPDVIEKIVSAGLFRVGFGVDGAAPSIWKKTKKPQTKSECIKAIAIAKEQYGLIVENLMVFGYNKYGDEESLHLAYDFTQDMYERYGAIPRPHIAKDIIPGNDGWRDKKNEKIVNQFINTPMLFQNLDFTALPSPYTHPDNEFRAMVEDVYLKICSLPFCLTQHVKPLLPGMSEGEMRITRNFNLKKYDI